MKDTKQEIKLALEAIQSIREKNGKKIPKREFFGVIECPRCKGRLHYRISSVNNHVWGKCETEGCLVWIM